ncbi:hypothetical protein C7Y47_07350 [Lysinibacillus sphaericus]|uniref:Uncharacterized protein n=1 Tax=Lysinibacillus sphaericus TaxID=1421 RepID=A0A544UQG6_LYSSH|nr:hypothetical protein [Lysinibacillus sp. SDF0037]TQR36084.1 hypothetical protein C7Y47_07350 [Lysinibacillus sp. SDF0037]
MKKKFYIGVLSTLILTACNEDEAASEEAPASEQKEAKEKTVNAYTKEVSEKNLSDEAIK